MKFNRRARLTTKADFRRVFAGPSVSKDRLFRVLSRPNGLPYNRLGMAVSRKACRKASGRNRLKRLIRESFRYNQANPVGAGGLDLVVLPSAFCDSICNQEIFASLDQHWMRSAERAKTVTR